MTGRPPRIGLSSCFMHADPDRPVFTGKTLLYVEQSMVEWIRAGDALVYPVPPADEAGGVSLAGYVDDLDGLVLHGGADVAPTSYGEEPIRPEWAGDAVRDAYELDLVRRFLDARKPVLGICRGIQVLNVALGGTLYQDLVAQDATERVHRDAAAYDRNEHDVVVEGDGRLASLVPSGTHRVNSVHHQGIKDLAPGLAIEARSADDDVVEAVRLDGDASWCTAVQWHPEFVRPGDTHLLDDGPLRSAFLDQARGHPVRVVNPATGGEIADLAEDTVEGLPARFGAAREAQPAWAARPLADRIATLGRFRDLVAERRDELAATLTSETGKPISQSRNELAGVLPRIDFFLEHTAATLEQQVVLHEDALDEVIAYEPLGVIANISAWNYPWFVGTNVFVPALLTGNAVLYKPSEISSLTGLAIADLLHDAGVPDAVFQVVIGSGPIGAALLDLPVDGVFFTGSYATGRAIAEAVAGRMIRVQLELGGKDPVYVTDDVDVTAAADGIADGAFYNAGQSCCAVERIYVHRSVHDAFVERFVETVQSFVVGDPSDEATYLGPLSRPAQLDLLDAQIADATARGATVRSGGHRNGAWFEPTVVVGATPEMDLMRDESFGPVIGIQVVDSDDEAVAAMNDTAYGLTAGVYCRDRSRAEPILARMDAGSVYWNCCDRVSPRLPWSGRGQSGIGSTLSTLGILTFVQPKAWHLRRP